MGQPHITAGIVTFRTDLTMLRQAVDSLLACPYPIELWLVDNTPEPAYFDTLKQAFPTAHALRSPGNFGYGFGHNLALKQASGAPYHLILNPDIIVHPGCIEALLAAMEADPTLGLTVPRILNSDGSLQALNKRDPSVLDLALRRFAPTLSNRRMAYYTMMDIGYDQPCDVPYASGCFMFFRRAILDAINGFDEQFFMYFEDADITRRARALASVRYIPQAVVTHAWARGSHTSRRLMLATFRSAGQYFHKWGWKWA